MEEREGSDMGRIGGTIALKNRLNQNGLLR
jgi:hypothetical protein